MLLTSVSQQMLLFTLRSYYIEVLALLHQEGWHVSSSFGSATVPCLWPCIQTCTGLVQRYCRLFKRDSDAKLRVFCEGLRMGISKKKLLLRCLRNQCNLLVRAWSLPLPVVVSHQVHRALKYA